MDILVGLLYNSTVVKDAEGMRAMEALHANIVKAAEDTINTGRVMVQCYLPSLAVLLSNTSDAILLL